MNEFMAAIVVDPDAEIVVGNGEQRGQGGGHVWSEKGTDQALHARTRFSVDGRRLGGLFRPMWRSVRYR